MDRRFSAIFIFKSLLWFIAPIGFLGWLLGYFWPVLALALVAVLAWHYFYQYKLVDWLWHRRAMLPPRAPGSWSYIYDGIYRTQRRSQQRRRALVRLLRRFREAAEAIPDAAIVFSRTGGLIWCNKLGQFYFGLKWPSDAGIRLSNLIRHPEFIAYLRQGDFTHEIHLPSPVNADVELEVRVMPYSDEQFLLIARDVTQLKQLEQMRKDFVANVSHELKTPLTVLQGYLELLEQSDALPPAMLNKAITEMQGQSERMSHLVNQLLSLSRMEISRYDLFERVVDMPQLLNVIATEMNQLNQAKQHQLSFHIDPIKIHGFEDELRSVVINLIANAIHYTPAQGVIEVSWRQVGDEAEFTVTDNGPGIAAEHLGRLTERFYRVDKDRNSKTGGTGLGLAIVQQALDHHHSRLEIESTPGQGSRFSFRISQELIIKA